MHLQTTSLYGNSTDLEYFYVQATLGSHRQPQALILDTGSSLAAVPCLDFCTEASCGDHINELYDFSRSTSGKLLSCRDKEYSCRCIDGDKCQFY